ncbi:hypothetical protein WISP_64589 [Willisornis vidua]|uniref:Uncharacterized protein n=1 Tax=Willisornis vidua TaxID=1566151 RepID=A0ABQ9DE28_9PASS|nr:hypothetical protein WISP_64589 [Willisornis vidua]
MQTNSQTLPARTTQHEAPWALHQEGQAHDKNSTCGYLTPFLIMEGVWIPPDDNNAAPFLKVLDEDNEEEVAQIEEYGKAESEGPRRDLRACRSCSDGEAAELSHRNTGKKTY